MLGKLVKYDLMAGVRSFLVLLACFVFVVLYSFVSYQIGFRAVDTTVLIISAVLSIVLIVNFIVISVKYFAETVVGKESYLTHTLPMHINKILLAKFFTISIWAACYCAVLVVFWVLLNNILLVPRLNMDIFQMLQTSELEFTGLSAFVVVTVITNYIMTVAVVGFSVSLAGVPWIRNKGASVPAVLIVYVVLHNVIGIIQMVILALLNLGTVGRLMGGNFEKTMADVISGNQPALFSQVNSVNIITGILFSILFFFLTSYILRKHRTI